MNEQEPIEPEPTDGTQLDRIEHRIRNLQFSVAWGGTFTSAALILIIILLLKHG